MSGKINIYFTKYILYQSLLYLLYELFLSQLFLLAFTNVSSWSLLRAVGSQGGLVLIESKHRRELPLFPNRVDVVWMAVSPPWLMAALKDIVALLADAC